ncbi:DUF3093 domain-containing protein [Pseudonocardia bannensis]|uniref:DUF3093 domain-containing protein n=1 Tax=Pseudonocardia bannensis TaxID=630973 RepID=A0A848DKI0_9PSEU|nr:DUF3093 domain-containing protein [Pseudonocardia bannensis]NMH93240.1 DUF3093 domain-containing protein [Pseudonocardia bannensis]
MSKHQPVPESATSGRLQFDERLSVPWWWYPPAVGIAVLLGAEVHMGYPGVRSWIGYAIAVPLLLGALVWLGRTRVQVKGRELRVGNARLPLRYVGRTEIVAKQDKQVALGPELDPAAFLLHRAWVGQLVRVELLDPEDPTPYWIFSTRDPDGLVAALRR